MKPATQRCARTRCRFSRLVNSLFHILAAFSATSPCLSVQARTYDDNTVSKLTVIIKRNASYEKGAYGLSIQTEPGGSPHLRPINSEADLLAKLLAFGVTQSNADIIKHLKNKHDSVKIVVEAEAKPATAVSNIEQTDFAVYGTLHRTRMGQETLTAALPGGVACSSLRGR